MQIDPKLHRPCFVCLFSAAPHAKFHLSSRSLSSSCPYFPWIYNYGGMQFISNYVKPNVQKEAKKCAMRLRWKRRAVCVAWNLLIAGPHGAWRWCNLSRTITQRSWGRFKSRRNELSSTNCARQMNLVPARWNGCSGGNSWWCGRRRESHRFNLLSSP